MISFLRSTNIHKLKILKNYRHISLMENKKSKIMPKIGTHDGNFHCDEMLACYMLHQLDEYKNAEIIRSRDLNILKTCDILVDVGREFNASEKKFDHHQSNFTETMSTLRPELGLNYNIRLSSAGLIYTYFGEQVIENILKNEKDITLPKNSLYQIYKKIYENFIREIDAIDNGIPICDNEQRYKITTDLSSRIGNLYPSWNCKENVDIMAQFKKGEQIVGDEFKDRIIGYATVWLPARDIVKSAIENAVNIHETGAIMELSVCCPWKEHFFDLEKEYEVAKKIRYVLFYGGENDWRVMCVPNEPSSFICKKFLHKDWRGCSAEKIAEISGIKDANFCHSTGFIGGALTREGAFEMALQSLNGDYVD